jgi:carboxymethylenebutenolidase
MADEVLTVVGAAGDRRGGVVLLQEAFGVTPYLLDVARRLSEAGWTTAVPHLYHRSGSPTFAYDVSSGDGVDSRDEKAERDAGAAIGPHALQLTLEGLTEDVDGALAALASRGIEQDRTCVLGFCFGGSLTLYTAAVRDLGAGVVFYGAGIGSPHFAVPPFVDVADSRTTPLLAFYGAQDKWIPARDVDTLEAAMTQSQAPAQVVRYAGAEHGFHCDLRRSYHPEAASAAWSRALGWMSEHVSAS